MAATQPTLSSYFSSRPNRKGGTESSHIDLTISDDEHDSQPPRKRQRTGTPELSATDDPDSRLEASPVAKWRYNSKFTRNASTKVSPNSRKSKLRQTNNPLRKKASTSTTSTNNASAHQEPSQPGSSSRRRGAAPADKDLGPSGQPYSPLEKQVIRLKAANPGTVLFIEVGYKYKFYEEDAFIAAKELGMVAHPDRNLHVASIPVHRKDVHLQKLLSNGYRVGICDQTETAALKKVGDNRNAPFERQVTELYTAATHIHSLDGANIEGSSNPCILSIVEHAARINEVSFSIFAITPSTGDVVWDLFPDSKTRLELETRIAYLCPPGTAVDLICSVSKPTMKLVQHLAKKDRKVRVETVAHPDSSGEAFRFVADFSNQHSRGKGFMSALSDIPDQCYPSLSHLIRYLDKFGLSNNLRDSRLFNNFQQKTHMRLAANTLRNLEILENSTDGSLTGSLFTVLNRTRTRFGARLLREWLTKPLVDHSILCGRLDAVEELYTTTGNSVAYLQQSLDRIPDLARGLSRVSSGQATCEEFATTITAFDKLGAIFQSNGDLDNWFKSPLLNSVVAAFKPVAGIVTQIKTDFNLKKGAAGKLAELWNDQLKYPIIPETIFNIREIENELDEEMKSIRKLLKRPSLQYTQVAEEEYLIELPKSDASQIPPAWTLMSKTRYLVRYRPPKVAEALARLCQQRETLDAACRTSFKHFMKDVTREHHYSLRESVNKLAEADCLISFTQIALSNEYVRPTFCEEDKISLIDGRHPIQETIQLHPQIPNSLQLGGSSGSPRHTVLTGPNMAGKSSFVRMVAVICLMAQCGCFVPAKSLEMKPLDLILTRMGASDDIMRGKSTFAVEMEETSSILSSVTNSSLVILDELGRGTSTHDGVAIAEATLEHLVTHVNCKTMFITHYPSVSRLATKFPEKVGNLHMAYEATDQLDGSQEITFLYKVIPGVAQGSFGIECAKLAGLPEPLLATARKHAAEIQHTLEMREAKRKTIALVKMLHRTIQAPPGSFGEIEKLSHLADSRRIG